MRKIMVAVMSRDGFIASKSMKMSEWVSEADSQYFEKLKNKHSLFVMGRKTYEDNAGNIRPRSGLLRVVQTNNPLAYSKIAVPGQLEFTNESAEELVKRFQKEKRKSMLILGGSTIYSAFLNDGLVDKIKLTIEPVDLGSGVPLLEGGRALSSTQELPEPVVTEMNDEGTVHYQYTLN